ncbi:hybrid sensor histidine kinase/response regulator [Neptunomonas phycophila]|uniref:hybrid sensor histidine kinase/response regulator n=1 Tax=Neptunomonas phycophila TaxID=1572645 RepID=UPI0009F87AEF|nr:response regulator [Neptunomonas phycophila]
MSELSQSITDFIPYLQQVLTSNERSEAVASLDEMVETLVEQASEEELPGAADALALQLELYGQLPDVSSASMNSACQLLVLFPKDLLRLLAGDSSAVDDIIEVLSSDIWPRPISLDDLTFLLELLHDDCAAIVAKQTNDKPAQSASLDEEEIVFCTQDPALLTDDISQVDGEVLSMLSDSIRALLSDIDEDLSTQALQQLPTDLAPIIRAAKSVQLYAVQCLLEGLCINVHSAAEQGVEDADTRWVTSCVSAVAAYLDSLAESTADDALSDALLPLFSQPSLPVPLTPDQAEYLRQLMAVASVKTATVIEPEVVTDDHLSMPDAGDIDEGLMTMLHDELPMLVDSLMLSLQHAQKADNDKQMAAAQLMDAQRYAHTLKGLANMAGLSAISHITHRMEDILEAVCDAKVSLGRAIRNDLQMATDSLAQIVDALLAGSPVPDVASTALQSMMDWYYTLRSQGVDAVAGDAMSSDDDDSASVFEAREVVQEEVEAEPPVAVVSSAPAVDDTQFRVPRVLLDDLFRITGENTALTSQLSDELAELRGLTRISRDRHRQLQKLLLELEQHLNESYTLQSDEQTSHSPEEGDESSVFDPLEMDRYHEMHTSFSMLNETAADVREVDLQMAGRVQKLNDLQIAQAGVQRETLDAVMRARQVAVSTLTARFERIMRQACRATDKRVELTIEGGSTLIDSQILNQLTGPLMHLIRNAVDHGIETPHLRFEASKPETGRLTLRFRQQQDRILIECEDDGAGIDAELVRAKAIERGLISESQEVSTADIQQLILLPGFSTRRDTSQLSGRGIGMDVVHQEIRRLHGTLSIEARQGQGTRFLISLPSSSLMIRALLVRSRQQVYALSSSGLGQTILSLDGALIESQGELYFEHQGERYTAYPLESLVGEPLVDYRQHPIFQVILVEAGGETVAVLVSEVITLRELVFKQMGPYVPEIPGIPGLTLLSNGAVAPVIDLATRLDRLTGQNHNWLSQLEQQPVSELPLIMVVDDSLSARKSLALLLKDAGFEVCTAIDGVDAIRQIEKKAPHLIVTDLEMPRMNGMELASTVISRSELADIPVMMITSRSTQKHRVEAAAAGVSVYLTKPWNENELLDHVEALLGKVANKSLQAVMT